MSRISLLSPFFGRILFEARALHSFPFPNELLSPVLFLLQTSNGDSSGSSGMKNLEFLSSLSFPLPELAWSDERLGASWGERREEKNQQTKKGQKIN